MIDHLSWYVPDRSTGRQDRAMVRTIWCWCSIKSLTTECDEFLAADLSPFSLHWLLKNNNNSLSTQLRAIGIQIESNLETRINFPFSVL